MDIKLCGELVARCFQARTDAHIAHLTTRSYAQHKALNDFYDEIVGLADTFAEAAQGCAGILAYPQTAPKNEGTDTGDPLTIPVALGQWLDDNREQCCDESELQNIIDEITALCDSTVYKLKFLA